MRRLWQALRAARHALRAAWAVRRLVRQVAVDARSRARAGQWYALSSAALARYRQDTGGDRVTCGHCGSVVKVGASYDPDILAAVAVRALIEKGVLDLPGALRRL